jgi:5-methyltetrahydrofolate--homocysteine methyltransferase
MANVARLLEKYSMSVPLMIGGATTSEQHTALMIAPAYSGPTVWMKDASQNVIAAEKLLNPNTREQFTALLRQQQESVRAQAGKSKCAPIAEARNNKPCINF